MGPFGYGLIILKLEKHKRFPKVLLSCFSCLSWFLDLPEIPAILLRSLINHEIHEKHEKGRGRCLDLRSLKCKSDDTRFRVLSKVDQHTKPYPGRFQVIDHLRFVFWSDCFYCFEFNNDLIEANKICLVGLLK